MDEVSAFDPSPRPGRGERIAEAMRRKWQDPDFRARQVLGRMGARVTKEVERGDCGNCGASDVVVMPAAPPHRKPKEHVDPMLTCAECFNRIANLGDFAIVRCSYVPK